MFGKGAGEVANGIVGIADKLIVDKDKKQELAASIAESELSSGSSFVRNTRPLIVRVGLVLIVLEFFGLRFLALKAISADKLMIENSTEIFRFFIMTWSGIVSVYVGGRTYEKVKARFFKK